MTAAVAHDVGVHFFFDRQHRVATPTLARLRRRTEETWGLRGLSVEIDGGTGVALIGPSGSGKTTLLRVLAGVLAPDEGVVDVDGRIASVLSVQAGLMPTLTGRENCVLLGVLLGLSRREARRALDELAERTALGDEFDHPVSSYSQGMRARLAIAVLDRIDPTILLLDEVHEALDHEFRLLLARRAREIVAAGGIVVAAGHDHEMLRRFCTRAVLLEHGHVARDGSFDDVRRSYVP